MSRLDSSLDEWLTTSGPGTLSRGDTSNLGDLLERVLDKGVVIAGDVSISLVDVELLTIKLRLLVASVDKAKEMGIDWWEHDPWLSSRATPDELEARVRSLEAALGQGRDGQGRADERDDDDG